MQQQWPSALWVLALSDLSGSFSIFWIIPVYHSSWLQVLASKGGTFVSGKENKTLLVFVKFQSPCFHKKKAIWIKMATFEFNGPCPGKHACWIGPIFSWFPSSSDLSCSLLRLALGYASVCLLHLVAVNRSSEANIKNPNRLDWPFWQDAVSRKHVCILDVHCILSAVLLLCWALFVVHWIARLNCANRPIYKKGYKERDIYCKDGKVKDIDRRKFGS